MIPLVAVLTSGAFAAGCWCGAKWFGPKRPRPESDPGNGFDTLLQGLEGLILRFQYGADQLPADHPARMAIEQALAEAEHVVEQSRNAVGNNAGGLNERDLATALSRAGAEFNHDRGVEFQLTTGGLAPRLSATLLDELYLIGREVMLSAFQHARTRVHVALTFSTNTVHLRCRDDGGMSDAKERMRELDHLMPRAEAVNARISVNGCLCGDTEVIVTARFN